MSHEWGRSEHAGEWPNRHPLWTYAVMFLALVSLAAVCVYRYAEYGRPWSVPTSRNISVRGEPHEEWPLSDAQLVGRKGSRLALDDEVVPVTMASGENTFALTEEAVRWVLCVSNGSRGYMTTQSCMNS